jgi:hypothetical protein
VTGSGDVVTFYSWTEHRRPEDDEEVCFHIGGYSRCATEAAKRELSEELPRHDRPLTAKCKALDEWDRLTFEKMQKFP